MLIHFHISAGDMHGGGGDRGDGGGGVGGGEVGGVGDGGGVVGGVGDGGGGGGFGGGDMGGVGEGGRSGFGDGGGVIGEGGIFSSQHAESTGQVTPTMSEQHFSSHFCFNTSPALHLHWLVGSPLTHIGGIGGDGGVEGGAMQYPQLCSQFVL